MKLYHAGSATHTLYDCGVRRPLLAYSDVGSAAFQFWIGESPAGADVFLDCGAYAAYMHGRTVDLGEYCDYLSAHADRVGAYAALDVIGDWRASAAHLETMLARGLRPVPVFHRGSPLSELDRLAREHHHIALGGMMSLGGQKMHRQTPEFLQPHLDAVFRVLERHWPVRVHLFGSFTQWVLERYPVFSADSATVVLGAALGTYARFQHGIIRWKYWWEDVPETLDGALGDLSGSTKAEARAARWRTSAQSMLRFERHVTDIWTQRGVSWAS